jgi:hypothetical protein
MRSRALQDWRFGAIALVLVGGCSGSEVADACAGVVCAQGRVCVSGQCQEASSCEGKTCLAGTVCVNGACVPALDGSSGKGDGGGCTPSRTEKGKATCGPCQEAERTCQANGSWGPFGTCQDRCSTGLICKDEKCLACEPGKTDTQPCSCGTKTRTCSSEGAWSNWGACVESCKDPFKCENGRCTRHYAASADKDGPPCRVQCDLLSLSYVNQLYCSPGDYCDSLEKCHGYEDRQPGDIYHGYPAAGGPTCGKLQALPCGAIQLRCKSGDQCQSSTNWQCRAS